jgi:hypothetical protein
MLLDLQPCILLSAELSATNLCFLLYQETVVDPTLKIPPDVVFLFDGIPTQSASVKPQIHSLYLSIPKTKLRVVPLRYLNTCFATFQYSLVVLTMA